MSKNVAISPLCTPDADCLVSLAAEMLCPSGSRVLEVVLHTCSESRLGHMYDVLLKDRLKSCSLHPLAHHVLDTFLCSVQDPQLVLLGCGGNGVGVAVTFFACTT